MSVLIPVSEAAARLDLSEIRVRQMCAAGDLPARQIGGRWLLDADGVLRHEVMSSLAGDSRGRPWSQPRAWAAMRALDGDDRLASQLSDRVRSRMDASLTRSSPQRLLAAVRNRATPVRVAVHRSAVDRVRDQVLGSGLVGAGLHGHGLTGGQSIDGYVDKAQMEGLRRDLGVLPDSAGGHILRVVDSADVMAGLDVAPRLAVAADLIDHVVTGRGEGVDGRVVEAARALLAAVSSS